MLPADAPFDRVFRALAALGCIVRRQNKVHVQFQRMMPDGRVQNGTLPDHDTVYIGVLSSALRQLGIAPREFMEAYRES